MVDRQTSQRIVRLESFSTPLPRGTRPFGCGIHKSPKDKQTIKLFSSPSKSRRPVHLSRSSEIMVKLPHQWLRSCQICSSWVLAALPMLSPRIHLHASTKHDSHLFYHVLNVPELYGQMFYAHGIDGDNEGRMLVVNPSTLVVGRCDSTPTLTLCRRKGRPFQQYSWPLPLATSMYRFLKPKKSTCAYLSTVLDEDDIDNIVSWSSTFPQIPNSISSLHD